MANKWKAGAMVTALILSTMSSIYAGPKDSRQFDGGGVHHIRRVLLISIDGMHAVDFLNCSKGIIGVNGGQPFCPNLAELSETGVNYLDTSTSKPSDSFPGLMALMTGGSPRTALRLLLFVLKMADGSVSREGFDGVEGWDSDPQYGVQRLKGYELGSLSLRSNFDIILPFIKTTPK